MAEAPYDARKFPPFAVTVDVIILTITRHGLSAVMIRRGSEPFEGALAIPGGFVKPDEDLDDAAVREFGEETGLQLRRSDLIQIGAYGAPDRDPRMRVVSVAYVALVADLPEPKGGSDAASAEIRAVKPMLERRVKLAFDHHRILSDAVDRIRNLVEHTPAATRFCPPAFTLADLRQVYEAVWDVSLDPANFRKRVLKTKDFVQPTGLKRLPKGDLGRLAETFERGPARELTPPLRRPGTYFHPSDNG